MRTVVIRKYAGRIEQMPGDQRFFQSKTSGWMYVPIRLSGLGRQLLYTLFQHPLPYATYKVGELLVVKRVYDLTFEINFTKDTQNYIIRKAVLGMLEGYPDYTNGD